MINNSILNTGCGIALCELAEIISGVFMKSSPSGNIRYIQVSDLICNCPKAIASQVDYMPKLDRYMIKPHDLLFAGKGTTYLCRMFRHDIPAVPSTSLFIIRPTSDRVTTEYLCWYLNHPKVVAAIKVVQAGSVTPMIHKATLESLRIVVPDIATQRRIVEVDALQRREVQLLKKLATKREQLTSQMLFDKIIQQTTI